jgi:hypothetical protein
MRTRRTGLIISPAMNTGSKILSTAVNVKIEESKASNLLNDYDKHSIPIKQEGKTNNSKEQKDD